MRNLNFKYAAAKNFLPFGPDGIELKFENFGNIIFIEGENLDAKPIDNQEQSSNGSGKSSIMEIIVWGLYGKTIKKSLKHENVVHNLYGTGCEVEIIWDKYRLVRSLKGKHTLRLWESEEGNWCKDTEISTSSITQTEKKIEEILGLSYDAFLNICIFTDDQSTSFLQCDGPKKREIVENLLSLEQYRQWAKNVAETVKEKKKLIKNLEAEYTLLDSNKTEAENRLRTAKTKETDWRNTRKLEWKTLLQKIEAKTKQLQTTDTGAALVAYQQAQEKIAQLNGSIAADEEALQKVKEKLKAIKNKDDELKNRAAALKQEAGEQARKINDYQAQIRDKKARIAALNENVPNTRCDKCYGVIEEENYADVINRLTEEINQINAPLAACLHRAQEITTAVEEIAGRQKTVNDYFNKATKDEQTLDARLRKHRNELVAASQVREPKADSAELLVQQEIEQLKVQAEGKEKECNGPSPYAEIIVDEEARLKKAVEVCEEKRKQIESVEGLMPYYQYWATGFGEKGIRKFVIDGIIPELNRRIAYWLQFLIDNKITLTFDNELNETIERNPPDGDPYVYYALSAGQRRRLNLAVSQAFADIMMISTGSVPSLVFLDEVTTNIDPCGVVGIHNMIRQLAEDKQVFITTHNPRLVRMFEDAYFIRLVHENGVTRTAT